MKAHQYLATSIATLLATAAGQRAMALPKGEAVAHGNADFKRDGSKMEIRASDRAVINFRGFNIDAHESVTFVQPDSKARVLNRVADGNPTRIFGRLNANGQVVLVNPSGVFFQNGSMVNVGGLIAAAGQMSDEDFLAGRNRVTGLSGEVSNEGTIQASGDVSLLGAQVSNSGTVESSQGMVSMVAGDEVLVGERGGNVFVSGGTKPAGAGQTTKGGVSNAGKIAARHVRLGAGDFFAVQHSGEIRSQDVAIQGGKGGRVEVSGKIDASVKGGKGGRIEVTGETVALSGARLDASGDAGGGEILVGGDWQGKAGVERAVTTTVDSATVLRADATQNGAGGKVVVWADGATQFDGRVSARGKGAGQVGGDVETSGKLRLGVGASARVDAGSDGGRVGNWLLDPTNLTIRAGGGGTLGGSGDEVVDASVINTALATVTLSATNDITFDQPVLMTANGAGLTAVAGGSLTVNPGITIETRNGAIAFTADSDGDGVGGLTLGAGSALITKGAVVTLRVDHTDKASTDGIRILGDIDTRNPSTGFGPDSTISLLGTNPAQNGVLEVGAVFLNAGHSRDAGSPSYFTSGAFDFYADEINLTGGANSVRGTGDFNLRPANLSTGVKLLASDDSTAGRLDISGTDLAAISSDFIATTFGRYDSGYTGQLVIGDAGGPALTIDRGVGGPGTVGFESGVNGVIANVNVQAVNTSYVNLRGNVIDLKQGLSAPLGLVSFIQTASSNVEVLDMTKPGNGPVAGRLRLDTAMLKGVGDTSNGLAIGNDATNRNSTLTIQDPLLLNSGAGAAAGRMMLQSGGLITFNAPVDAGIKTLTIRVADMQFGPGIATQVMSKNGLVVSPSGGGGGAGFDPGLGSVFGCAEGL